MIGTWQRFGEGESPRDGEGVVFIRAAVLPEALWEPEYGAEAVVAVHRGGLLFTHAGGHMPIPFGWYWTSLPSLPQRPTSSPTHSVLKWEIRG